MPYVLIIAGLLTMCVPDDANLMRFVMQGTFGLVLFIRGVMLAIERSENNY